MARKRRVVLNPAEQANAWELRGHWAQFQAVRVMLSEACDNVRPNREGARVLEGVIERVSPTGATFRLCGFNVPTVEVLRIDRADQPLHRQAEASSVEPVRPDLDLPAT